MLNRIFLGVMNIVGSLTVNGGNVWHALGSDLSTVGNDANTSQKDLNVVIVPANSLKNVGDKIHFFGWGNLGASANNKVRRLYINNQSVMIKTGTAASQSWDVSGFIIKINATQQKVVTNTSQTNNLITASTILTEDLSLPLTIKTTGQNTAVGTANDIVSEGLLLSQI